MRLTLTLALLALTPASTLAQGYYSQPSPPPGYRGAPPLSSLRNGMTVELNLGIGWAHASNNDGGTSATSGAVLGGLDLGVGGWINPKMALTGRIAGVSDSQNGVTAVAVFVGPSLQYWLDNNFWLGGGAGFSRVAAFADGDSIGINGFGLDLRAGYTFTPSSENTFNLSVELTPGFYDGGNITGIALLAGYQHL